MIYRCTKELEITYLDEDGRDTEKYSIVPYGSLWELSDCFPISDAEIRMDSLIEDQCDFDWIEISEETLKNSFVQESEEKKWTE